MPAYLTVYIADPNQVVRARLVKFRSPQCFASRIIHAYPVDLFIRLRDVFEDLGLNLDCNHWDMRIISMKRDLEKHATRGKNAVKNPKRPAGREHTMKSFRDNHGIISKSLYKMSQKEFHKMTKIMASRKLRRDVLYVKYKGPDRETEYKDWRNNIKFEKAPDGSHVKYKGPEGRGWANKKAREEGRAAAEKGCNTALADYIDFVLRSQKKAQEEKAEARVREKISSSREVSVKEILEDGALDADVEDLDEEVLNEDVLQVEDLEEQVPDDEVLEEDSDVSVEE